MSVIQNEQLSLPYDILPEIEDEQYDGLQPYIDLAKAFAQITYKSIYIIDYYQMNFLYVSDNPLFLGGEDVEKVQREGYNFYYQHVPEEDLEFLTQINKAGFDFFKGIPVSERTQYTISYNFRITQKESKENILINHQITPLKLDSMGNIWLALCLVSLAPTQEIGTAHITALKSNTTWQFSLKSGRWKQLESIVLTEQEKAVIRLANQGLSVDEIACEIHGSEDSVKSYRKSLFQKTQSGEYLRGYCCSNSAQTNLSRHALNNSILLKSSNMETKKEDYLSPSIDFLWLEACSLLTSWSAELIDGMDEGDPDTFHGIEYKEYE